MKKFNLAIEKGKRYLRNDSIVSFYFIATEFIFEKKDIISGYYRFQFLNNNDVFFEQHLYIDIDTKKVIIENSHEDPLIESDNHYFICGQLTEELLDPDYKEIECLFYYENTLLRKHMLSYKEIHALFYADVWHSEISNFDDNKIITNKDCIVRLHLGKHDTTYEEEEYELKKNQCIDFKKYLNEYEYVAVQCSYEDVIDIEEKHVLKGLKGIYNSQYYMSFEGNLHIPMIPFSEKYSIIKKGNWINIHKIEQLLSYYHHNEQDIYKTFEMNSHFLHYYYKQYKTSAVGNLYTNLESKKYHIDTQLCQQCPNISQCMQLVPSGLSELVFKKNLMVESFENCSIYKLINKKDKYV